MHHDVYPVAVIASCVGGLAAEENACVRVHSCLVLRDGLVELPDDDALGVVEQVLTHTGDVLDDGYAERGELVLGAQTREKHEAGSVDCASAEDGFAFGRKNALFAVLEGYIHAEDLVALNIDLADPCVGQDSQVLPLLLIAKNGVDVGNGSAASAAIVGVVRNGEETNTGLESALGLDLVVEVMDHGNIHGGGAGIYPVQAELVSVVLVYGLDGVA